MCDTERKTRRSLWARSGWNSNLKKWKYICTAQKGRLKFRLHFFIMQCKNTIIYYRQNIWKEDLSKSLTEANHGQAQHKNVCNVVIHPARQEQPPHNSCIWSSPGSTWSWLLLQELMLVRRASISCSCAMKVLWRRWASSRFLLVISAAQWCFIRSSMLSCYRW